MHLIDGSKTKIAKHQVTKKVFLSNHLDLFISRKLWAEGGLDGVLCT